MALSSCVTARRLASFSLLAAFAIVCSARTAHASAHLWQIKEIYTNANGSVQFVEMFTTGPSEVLTNGTTLNINDGTAKSFQLDDNLDQSTASRHLLFATPNFLAASGISPDFTFPSAPFFNPNAASFTISYSASGDSITFAGSLLPKNGINSLTDTNLAFPGSGQTLTVGSNSPMNLNNDSGSVVPGPTGDYNGNGRVDAADYIVWRNTKGQAASPSGSGADGSNNGTIDDNDYTFWRSKFGNSAGSGAGQGAAVPEPAGAALILATLLAITSRRRKA